MTSAPDNPGAPDSSAAAVAAAAAAKADRTPRDARRKNIYTPTSLRLSIINWWHVAMLYVQPAAFAMLAAAVAIGVARGTLALPNITAAWAVAQTHVVSHGVVYGLAGAGLAALFMRRRTPVYLVDFTTFKPPASWRVSHEDIINLMGKVYDFSPESIDFCRRILARSATGQATHWPPAMTRLLERNPEAVAAQAAGTPLVFEPTMEEARAESHAVICGCVQDLMDRTGLKARDIDFLIINCSLFSPTPSLCAMVSNHFKLRSDCKTYNLGGMGCSAGVISIDLAKQLIRNRPNSLAVVVSTENLTQQLYLGNKRSMLLQNTLFRCGGAAMLLSSRYQDGFRAKYKLLHTVRFQNTASDAYECVYETEDEARERGIRLSKQITKIAGKALTRNLTILGPRVLTLREQAKVVCSLVARRVVNILRNNFPKWQAVQEMAPGKAYVPNFKKCIQHFCIHAGGRAVIDGIEENLALTPRHTEPSKATLRDFGNTSSSSIWYELEYIEDHHNIQRGHRVLQIAFGSGFKCNSAVWLRMR